MGKCENNVLSTSKIPRLQRKKSVKENRKYCKYRT